MLPGFVRREVFETTRVRWVARSSQIFSRKWSDRWEGERLVLRNRLRASIFHAIGPTLAPSPRPRPTARTSSTRPPPAPPCPPFATTRLISAPSPRTTSRAAPGSRQRLPERSKRHDGGQERHHPRKLHGVSARWRARSPCLSPRPSPRASVAHERPRASRRPERRACNVGGALGVLPEPRGACRPTSLASVTSTLARVPRVDDNDASRPRSYALTTWIRRSASSSSMSSVRTTPGMPSVRPGSRCRIPRRAPWPLARAGSSTVASVIIDLPTSPLLRPTESMRPLPRSLPATSFVSSRFHPLAVPGSWDLSYRPCPPWARRATAGRRLRRYLAVSVAATVVAAPGARIVTPGAEGGTLRFPRLTMR